MTLEEIDKLTIAEVRAINERAGEALRTLRDLGLAPPMSHASGPGSQSVAPVSTPRPVFDAEHLARKQALLAQNRVNVEELPAELQALERA